jgi:hypothetical protein
MGFVPPATGSSIPGTFGHGNQIIPQPPILQPPTLPAQPPQPTQPAQPGFPGFPGIPGLPGLPGFSIPGLPGISIPGIPPLTLSPIAGKAGAVINDVLNPLGQIVGAVGGANASGPIGTAVNVISDILNPLGALSHLF